MEVGFVNIIEHVIPMDNFALKWRFTDENYKQLPELHLNQLKPLDSEASKFLWDFICKTRLHSDMPFKRDFFKNIDKIDIVEDNKSK